MKYTRFLLIVISVLLVFSGCSNNELGVIQQENEQLKTELQALKQDSQKEQEIRRILDEKSLIIINAMLQNDIDTIKSNIVKETTCTNNILKCENYEYPFSNASLNNRMQTYWNWQKETNTFFIGYAIVNIEGNVTSPLYQEEFEYKLVDDEWKLVGIAEQ